MTNEPSHLILTQDLNDAEATLSLGARLAGLAQPGDVLCLSGGLGAGKTSLSRGFIRALCGADLDVPSPTYTLVQTYEAPEFEIWHFDLYRLKSPSEVYALGIEDALDEGVCLIEWPQRMEGLWPDGTVNIDITFNEDARRASLTFPAHWKLRLKGADFDTP